MKKCLKLPFLAVFSALILLLSAGCGSNSPTTVEDKSESAEQVELLVSAAASLTESLDELKSVYEA
ncbi:MAG: molybdate ABC transporter substrate-binding protein, partial [Paenibacillaceae bacterium]|nr:molybdate ABC transporter substrate-binding protein [Paenibacillaceae bacterium]